MIDVDSMLEKHMTAMLRESIDSLGVPSFDYESNDAFEIFKHQDDNSKAAMQHFSYHADGMRQEGVQEWGYRNCPIKVYLAMLDVFSDKTSILPIFGASPKNIKIMWRERPRIAKDRDFHPYEPKWRGYMRFSIIPADLIHLPDDKLLTEGQNA